jgi:NTE family protein
VSNRAGPRRAVILGGGGVAGIAWETGVLNGLAATGVDLARADAIIGTSAGSFAGAHLAAGSIPEFYRRQLDGEVHEISAAMPESSIAGFQKALLAGDGDPNAIGRGLGSFALRAQTIPAGLRQRVIDSRLAGMDWPTGRLGLTAIDCQSGVLRVFDRNDGISLSLAAAASGALPGLWPPVEIGGRYWIDGGCVSATNARLGAGFDIVLVLAPTPGFPGLPGVHEEIAELEREGTATALLTPDDGSRKAMGPNVFDPDVAGRAAAAGLLQAMRAGHGVRAVWR